jgi:2-keto-4-pentenoate hydratase/2-oxohepta-3-ene-1,7-dioic acid hydratase in catechol pathway
MKIFCIGRNYADHAIELNNPLPTQPIVFLKPDTAALREGKPFYLPEFSKNVQHELEIVLKICRRGKYIESRFAHNYYDQIGLGIDFTARDVQETLKKNGHPWEISKAFDNSAVIGDFVDKKNLDNLNHLHIELKVNGESRQNAHSSQLIFGFDAVITYISQYFTLSIGDLIYTGTPAGVQAVQSGDLLEGYLNGNKMLNCMVK